ncbi:DUF3987 domain-containing protein [Burkholderia sp. BE17]|uniref:DUF3987 domain-containing protein n=1 Tax=Burkholderia sp. BE17 TaxID=2656644 RepID=UPI00128B63A8|nr:DUF3987 domain-containing protein [Burkholderia sp. BE17]MPV71512.1 DUF3987 domain-containing protein [Burkholderia sp. BE17]
MRAVESAVATELLVQLFFSVDMSNGNATDHRPPGIYNPSQNADRDELSYRLPMQQGAYPVDAFPNVIRQAVVDVDGELGGGIELGASAALGVVSLVCQEFVNVARPRMRPTACSLFLVTIAETGAGKSEIQGRFASSLEQFERKEEARAKEAGDDYKDLSSRERLSRLRTLRADREERLAGYDALREQYDALEKKEKQPVVEGRGRRGTDGPSAAEREREQRQSIQQARTERLALKPRLDEFEKELAEIERTLRSLMGNTARRLVYGRGSFAGFRNGLQDRCRSAGVVSAEAGGILNSSLVTRNMDAWNDLWGTEFYRETYDKREYVIDAPRLTVALMLQPKQFERFMDAYGENALDNGFLSRTLLLKVPRQFRRSVGGGDEPAHDIVSVGKFHERVQQILDQDFPWITERIALKLTGKARRYWDGYYNELNAALDRKQFDAEMEGFVRKLPEQAARLAALFHYFEHYPISTTYQLDEATGRGTPSNNEIPVETVRAAVRLCDWYMAEFHKLVVSHELPEEFTSWAYSTQVRTNADRIYRTIQRNYRKYEARQKSSCIRLTYRDVQNGNRTIKGQAEILAALHCLAAEQKVHLGSGPNGGVFVCFNSFHAYCCNRCTSPQTTQSVQSPSIPSPVTESPGIEQSTERSESEPAAGAADGEWPIQENGSPVPSLLDDIRASNPRFFSARDTSRGTRTEEDDQVAPSREDVPKA